MIALCFTSLGGLWMGTAQAADQTGTIVSPAKGSTVSGSPLMATGTAQASAGVSAVKIGIRDTVAKMWLQQNGSWGPNLYQMPTTLLNQTDTTADWWTSVNLPDGSYGISLIVVDTNKVQTPTADRPWTTFNVVSASLPTNDTKAPLLQTRWPFTNQIFTNDGSLLFEGTGQDNVQVAKLELTLQDRVTKKWLSPLNTFSSTKYTLPVPLEQTDPKLAHWTYRPTLPAGSYQATLTLTDAAGNTDKRAIQFEYRPGAVSNEQAFATLLISRSQWVDAQNCVPTPGAKTLFDVADGLSSLGYKATGTVVQERQDETQRTCQDKFQINSSWQDLATLRDQYGWSFAVHNKEGTGEPLLASLTYDQQVEATCGDLQVLLDRGFSDAWGLFAYNGATTDATVQNDPVSKCFAYGRRYDSGVNPRSSVTAPYFVGTASINGGYCNDPTASCFDINITSDHLRYQMPDEIAERLKGYADRYTIIQLYRFVDGSNLTGPGTHYDCSDPNPARHWTGRTEVYCWNDYLAAVSTITSNVTVTSPAAVAEAWGRGNPNDQQ